MDMSRALGGRSLTTLSPMEMVPPRDILQTGDHPEQRRFAAAGRADEDDEFTVGNVDGNAMDHPGRCRNS